MSLGRVSSKHLITHWEEVNRSHFFVYLLSIKLILLCLKLALLEVGREWLKLPWRANTSLSSRMTMDNKPVGCLSVFYILILISSLLQVVTPFDIRGWNDGMRYALAEWVTFILLIPLMKQCLMILSFSLLRRTHHKLSSISPSRCRWVYNICIFLCTHPLTVCSSLNPQQEFWCDFCKRRFFRKKITITIRIQKDFQKKKGSLCLLDITKRIKRGPRVEAFSLFSILLRVRQIGKEFCKIGVLGMES